MDMRITNAYNAYSVQPTRTSTSVSAPGGRVERSMSGSDSISLSAQASDYQIARRAVANAPDVREGLVNQIRERLEAGTYNVSAFDVASRIFQGLG